MDTRSTPFERDEIIRQFGQRLANLLNEKNITRDTFAAGVNRDKSTVSNWINGRSFPRPDDLISISRYLSTSIDALMGLNSSIENRVANGYHWIEDIPDDNFTQDADYTQKIKLGIQHFNHLMKHPQTVPQSRYNATIQMILTALYSGYLRLQSVPVWDDVQTQELRDKFHLKHAFVMQLPPHFPVLDTAIKLELVAYLAARHVLPQDEIQFDEYVGIGPGTTIFRFIQHILPTNMDYKDVMWTGLTAEANAKESFTNHTASELATLMRSRHFGSYAYRPPFRPEVNDDEIKRQRLPEWEDVHRIFAGVTALADDYPQQMAGFHAYSQPIPVLLEGLRRNLRNSPLENRNPPIVGLYLGHLIDADGNEVDIKMLTQELSPEGLEYIDKVQAILKEIQSISAGLIRYHVQRGHSVWLIAAGNHKARATRAILEGSLANCVVLDSQLAEQLLQDD